MSTELNRQFQNLSTIGTVLAIDAKNWLMRLQIDDNETDWIPIPAMAAGVVKIWRCPTIGEQFSVISQGGELCNAIAQVSLFSEQNPSPSSDPHTVFIELGKHAFYVNIATGEAHFKLNKCTFDAAQTIFTGEVLVDQNLKVKNNVDVDGGITAQKTIQSFTDVVAITISLFKHLHKLVKSGTDNSGEPTS